MKKITNITKELSNTLYQGWIKEECGSSFITFFTPTYKRPHLLNRIYDCLNKQTIRNFVWILVNDGSNDNTDEVAEKLILRNDFPACYLSKQNGGKHSAFEVAFSRCQTEFFACMDDDDIYELNSVEVFLREWDRIKKEGRNDIGAIRVLSAESTGDIVTNARITADMFEKRIDQTTFISNYVKHEHMENWTCYSTNALSQIDLFPHSYWLSEHHKFYSETLWQGRFARKFKCRYYYHILREYRHDTESSILRGPKSRQHYMDMFINMFLLLNEQYDWVSRNLLDLLKKCLIVSVLRCRLHISFADMLSHTKSYRLKMFYLMLYPFGFLTNKPKFITTNK